MSITALPTPPQRSDPANFAARGDAFMTALPTFATEANALQTDVNAKQVTASNAATTATTQATNASASATAAASASNVSIWISGTTYAVGDNRFSPANFQTYRRKTAGAGTTDPSLDGTNWQIITSSMVLLATLTPTVAAAVSALNVFGSAYDSYIVIGEGLCPAAPSGFQLGFGVAGVLDSSSVYASWLPASTGPVGFSSTGMAVTNSGYGGVDSSGKGLNFYINVINVNSTSQIKTITGNASYDSGSGLLGGAIAGGYKVANAVSGVSFNFAGVNFKAQGTIRIYGISN